MILDFGFWIENEWLSNLKSKIASILGKMMNLDLWQLLAVILILGGLIGVIVPVLPSSPLVLAGCLLWAWAENFQRVGWGTIAVLTFIMVLSMLNEIWLKNWAAQRTGANWKTLLGAFVGGLGGGVVLSPILPVFGTLVGAGLGAAAGVIAVEYWQKRHWPSAANTAWNYCLGSLLSIGVNLLLCFIMLGVFIWQIARG